MQAGDYFVTLPELQHVIDSTGWDVTNEPRYYSDRYGCYITVGKNFHTDLASVPRFAWLLIPRDDKNIVEAAVVHDWLYYGTGRVGIDLCGDVPGAQYPRKRSQCDRILSDAMKLCGAPWWKRHVVYWSVRLGGWKPWRRDARWYLGRQ